MARTFGLGRTANRLGSSSTVMGSKYSEAQVRDILEQIAASRKRGLSVGVACSRVGICLGTYYRWKRDRERENDVVTGSLRAAQ